MSLVIAIVVRILEALFFLGMIGSAAVIVLTMVEDLEVMFEQEPPPGASGEQLT